MVYIHTGRSFRRTQDFHEKRHEHLLTRFPYLSAACPTPFEVRAFCDYLISVLAMSVRDGDWARRFVIIEVKWLTLTANLTVVPTIDTVVCIDQGHGGQGWLVVGNCL